MQQCRTITSATATDFVDLAFLKPLLENKRIVLLGESSHGIGDFYALKSRLVQYLHRELGFEVLAMESGMADVYFEYRKIDSLSAAQLRNHTVFGNFRCSEIMPLFDYLKKTANTPKPLLFAGFDSQHFTASLNLLQQLTQNYDSTNARFIFTAIGGYYRIPAMIWQTDKAPLLALADSIKHASRLLTGMLNRKQAEINSRYNFSESDMEMLKKAAASYGESVTLDWNTENPSAVRDSLMAANLFWLIDKIYSGKKIIIWAHNGHIDKSAADGNPFKWLGHFITEKYGNQSYAIGLFAKTGQTYEWWTKSVKPFNNNGANDLENLLSTTKKPIAFFDLSAKPNSSCNWMQKKYTAFEPENGGKLSFIPVRRFDAVILCNKVKPPTYR